MKLKKILSDIILNLVATMVPIVFLQFVIFPKIALGIGASDYGLMITVYGLVSMISGSLGNVLNNVRLITETKYNELKVSGDFSILLIIFLIINTVIIFMYQSFNSQIASGYNTLFFLSLSGLTVISGYGTVYYRLNLNFYKLVKFSFLLTLGYFVGFFVFDAFKMWEMVFLVSQAFAVLYICFSTNILKESLSLTSQFYETAYTAVILLMSGFLLSATLYIDRLILFPMLGGTAVTIFYVASLIGKTITTAVQPLATVILSYVSKMNSLNRDVILKIIVYSCLGAVLLCLSLIWVSNPLINYLYPDVYSVAIQYVGIAALSSVLIMITNLINPLLLKFYNARFQFLINLVYLIVYLSLSVFLSKSIGLSGFFIGGLVAGFIKVVLVFYILVFVKPVNSI